MFWSSSAYSLKCCSGGFLYIYTVPGNLVSLKLDLVELTTLYRSPHIANSQTRFSGQINMRSRITSCRFFPTLLLTGPLSYKSFWTARLRRAWFPAQFSGVRASTSNAIVVSRAHGRPARLKRLSTARQSYFRTATFKRLPIDAKLSDFGSLRSDRARRRRVKLTGQYHSV